MVSRRIATGSARNRRLPGEERRPGRIGCVLIIIGAVTLHVRALVFLPTQSPKSKFPKGDQSGEYPLLLAGYRALGKATFKKFPASTPASCIISFGKNH